MKHFNTYCTVLFTLMAVTALNTVTVLGPLITTLAFVVMTLALAPITVVMVKVRHKRSKS